MGQPPTLVDPLVTRKKFDKEVSNLLSLKTDLRKRGWIIESTDYPVVRITFIAPNLFPPAAATVDINFTNYNLWPPSVRFLHPTSFLPFYIPGARLNEEGKVQPVAIISHPMTKEPFLCLPGVCEYHTHPQHDGDSWDYHRYTGEGNLFFLLDHIWQYCFNNAKAFKLPFLNGLQFAFEAIK